MKEHKENLEKEFNELITNWMKEHPEVKKVYIEDDSYYFMGNSIFLHPDHKYKTTVYFK